MPKKKSAKTSSKSPHGELFDKHPNLKWLIPLFFVIAAVGIYIFKMASDAQMVPNVVTLEEVEIVNTTSNNTNSSSSANPMAY